MPITATRMQVKADQGRLFSSNNAISCAVLAPSNAHAFRLVRGAETGISSEFLLISVKCTAVCVSRNRVRVFTAGLYETPANGYFDFFIFFAPPPFVETWGSGALFAAL